MKHAERDFSWLPTKQNNLLKAVDLFAEFHKKNPQWFKDLNLRHEWWYKLGQEAINEAIPVLTLSQVRKIDDWVLKIKENPMSCAVYEAAINDKDLIRDLETNPQGWRGMLMLCYIANYYHERKHDGSVPHKR